MEHDAKICKSKTNLRLRMDKLFCFFVCKIWIRERTNEWWFPSFNIV